ncbi:MAG: alcohol dehydrogenase catalytic domain-containing protein [Acidimicrobiales bacterium]
MRAAIYRGPDWIEVGEYPDPQPGPGEILIEVHACGMCGSDLHAISAGWPQPGSVMGHEPAGVVTAVGRGVDHVGPGDRVAVVASAACGECRYCEEGARNLCTDRKAPTNGAYAEQIVVPAGSFVVRLPDNVTFEEGSILEPLSVAVRAVRMASPGPEARCAVVGLGAIGQCVVQALRAGDVHEIIGIDISKPRLDLARRSGANHVVDASSVDTAEALRDLAGSGSHRGYEYADVDFVFECSGALPVMREIATTYVRPSGTIVMVALFETDVSFDANPIVRKEVVLRGSYAYDDDDIRVAADLLTQRRVDLSGLVTHVVPLESISDALDFQRDAELSVKVVVAPTPSS